MSIFVSVVSYRDTELLPTIKDLYEKADNPQEIHFGVVSQDIDHPDLSFIQYLLYTKMDFREARGVGYARKLAMQLYRNEDFYLQIDSHTRTVHGWDTKMKSIYSIATKLCKNDKVILSQFPGPYEVHTNGAIYYPKNDQKFWNRPSWSKVYNKDHGGWSALRQEIPDLLVPHKSHTILAGYIFAPGNFIKEIPYDDRISFMGEEICVALRAFTRGWEIYAPNELLLWHYYIRKRSPKIWNQVDDMKRPLRWIQMEMESKRTQKSVLLGENQGVYGIADYNRYMEYQELIGINFADFYKNEINKKVNNSLKTQELIF